MKRAHTQKEIETFCEQHPEEFRGQLWEPCKCGREPVYEPSGLCRDCIMDGPSISSGAATMEPVDPRTIMNESGEGE
jgi:hypothetical protein